MKIYFVNPATGKRTDSTARSFAEAVEAHRLLFGYFLETGGSKKWNGGHEWLRSANPDEPSSWVGPDGFTYGIEP